MINPEDVYFMTYLGKSELAAARRTSGMAGCKAQFDVLARMRQHPTLVKVPLIMVTGYATSGAVLRGLLGDANGYITKPFEIEVLTKAVRSGPRHRGERQGDRTKLHWEHDLSRVDLS